MHNLGIVVYSEASGKSARSFTIETEESTLKISRPYEKQVAELLARFVNNGPEGIPNISRLDAGTQAELKKHYYGHLSSFKGQVSTRCTECNEKAHVMLATESDKLWAKFITLLAQVRLILERHLTLLIPQGQVASV